MEFYQSIVQYSNYWGGCRKDQYSLLNGTMKGILIRKERKKERKKASYVHPGETLTGGIEEGQ